MCDKLKNFAILILIEILFVNYLLSLQILLLFQHHVWENNKHTQNTIYPDIQWQWKCSSEYKFHAAEFENVLLMTFAKE